MLNTELVINLSRPKSVCLSCSRENFINVNIHLYIYTIDVICFKNVNTSNSRRYSVYNAPCWCYLAYSITIFIWRHLSNENDTKTDNKWNFNKKYLAHKTFYTDVDRGENLISTPLLFCI